MSRPHTSLRTAFALATVAIAASVLLFAPGRARAGGDPALDVPEGGVLFAGQRVELHWRGDTGDIEEMELLLEIDGAHRRTVQISPELDPGRGVYVWRVPELGRGERAHLVVRYDRDGREIEGRASRQLRILSQRDRPVPPALLPEKVPDGPLARGAAADGRPGSRSGESDESGALRSALRDAARTRSLAADPSLASPAGSAHSRSNTVPPFVPSRN